MFPVIVVIVAIRTDPHQTHPHLPLLFVLFPRRHHLRQDGQ